MTITKVKRGRSGTRTTFQTNFELDGSPYSIELKVPGSWPKVGRTVSFLYFWDDRDSENPHKGLIASTDSGIVKIIMDNYGWSYLVAPFVTSFFLIYTIYFILSKFARKTQIPHTQKRMGKTPTSKNLVMSLRDWFRKPLDEEFKKKFVEKAAWNAKVFFSIIVLFVLFIFVLMMNERFHIF